MDHSAYIPEKEKLIFRIDYKMKKEKDSYYFGYTDRRIFWFYQKGKFASYRDMPLEEVRSTSNTWLLKNMKLIIKGISLIIVGIILSGVIFQSFYQLFNYVILGILPFFIAGIILIIFGLKPFGRLIIIGTNTEWTVDTRLKTDYEKVKELIQTLYYERIKAQQKT